MPATNRNHAHNAPPEKGAVVPTVEDGADAVGDKLDALPPDAQLTDLNKSLIGVIRSNG